MEFIFKLQLLTKHGHARLLARNLVLCLANDGINYILVRWLSLVDSWRTIVIMKIALLIVVVYFFYCEGAIAVTTKDDGVVNNRPIIGVLSQEQSPYLQTIFREENYTSYIAAGYVKDVESSGARVVPIMIGKDRSYYRNLMEKLNGVLFPGGATSFNESNGYADAGEHIMSIAKEMNDAGDYFPLFGTCLGFELFIILESGRGYPENRIRCYSYDNLPLTFTKDFEDSKMFKNAPDDIIYLLKHENVTVNAHQFCIVDENLKSHNLTKDWRVTSYSDDHDGVEFIASIEHTRYPFYGVQFHPEKSSFEWKLNKHFPSTAEAIKSNRYFMDFFVNECRKSSHSFRNAAEENQYLIYNHIPYFTGVLGSAYHQCYLFEPRGTVKKSG